MPRSEGGGQQGKITSPPFLYEFSRVKERIFVNVFLFEIRKYQANLFRVHTAQTYWRERRGGMEQEEEEEEVVLREVLDLLSPALLPSASLGRKGGREEGFGSLCESLSQSFLKQSSFDAPPFPPFLAAQRRRKGRDLKAEFSKEKTLAAEQVSLLPPFDSKQLSYYCAQSKLHTPPSPLQVEITPASTSCSQPNNPRLSSNNTLGGKRAKLFLFASPLVRQGESRD